VLADLGLGEALARVSTEPSGATTSWLTFRERVAWIHSYDVLAETGNDPGRLRTALPTRLGFGRSQARRSANLNGLTHGPSQVNGHTDNGGSARGLHHRAGHVT
jgi:hypothetical protein